MVARRQRGTLELRAGVWSLRIWSTRTTPEGSVRERLRIEVGPSSKLRTRAAARLAADRILARQGIVHTGRAIAFNDFAQLYERDHLPVLQATTRAAYRSHLRCHLVPFLKDTLLHDIHPSAPAVLVARMTGKKLSRPTISATVGLLGNMLQKAGELGYDAAQVNRRAYKLPPRGVPKERRCMTPAESDQIIQASGWPYRALYALLAYQGLRCSEVLALEWRHVNLATGLLSIRQATTFGQIKITKSTNSATDMPMAPALIEILKAYHAHVAAPIYAHTPGVVAGSVQVHGLLFPSANGKPQWAGDVRRHHFRPLLKRLQIRPAGLHAFRHGLATNLFAAGVSAPVVRSMMRHGDIKTTLGYTHVESADQRQAALASGQLITQARLAEAAKQDPTGPTTETATLQMQPLQKE